MILNLYEDFEGKTSMPIIDSTNDCVQLPAKDTILFDTNILLALIVPPEERTPEEMLEYSQMIAKKKMRDPFYRNNERCFVSKLSDNGAKKLYKRSIKVVGYIENREFQKVGIKIGWTNQIANELMHLEELCGGNSAKQKLDEFSDCVYNIFFDVPDCRRKNRDLSSTFKENGNFSLAYAGFSLGCDIATDDYASFCPGVLNRLNRFYAERWGTQKRLVKHDSDSLLMLMNSKLGKH